MSSYQRKFNSDVPRVAAWVMGTVDNPVSSYTEPELKTGDRPRGKNPQRKDQPVEKIPKRRRNDTDGRTSRPVDNGVRTSTK